MSPRLPTVSGKQAVAAPERSGYEVVRQRCSHVRLRHRDAAAHKPITIPLHRELRTGLLRAVLRDAGLTPQQFAGLLRG